ncbi:VPEID-CTERM sorting domain-containing protein [uncultured Roseobacter sp.]|uniref:VPEID-CTERM sorting domain-containing protein n=1 Tax=uncultured Roseobacter sp. TaxID=114847 RepID=UPI00260AD08F|nr:VPEID-CTERM sorting domain-containing protein [uncultured Roseobacter sp.]
MKKVALAAIATLAALPVYATGTCPLGQICDPVSVPEISALEGTAALAALAAVVLIAWERRRRAA